VFGVASGGGSPVSWWALLVTGLVLAVPLSIPVLNIFAFAFRVPLLQAFCFLGAMILLAAEVAIGTRPLLLGLLPLSFFLLFALQRVGGPILLARLERDNDAVRPVEPGEALVRLHLSGRSEQRFREAEQLMRVKGLAQLLVPTGFFGRRGRLFLRPTTEAYDMLRKVVPPRDLHASGRGLWIDPVDVGRLRPEIDVRVRHGGTFLLMGEVGIATVRSAGTRQRLSFGRPAIVGNWPLFTFFYDARIFSGSTGNGRWYAGFVPGRATALRQERAHNLLDAVFADAQPSIKVGLEHLRGELQPLRPYFTKRAAAEARRRRAVRRACLRALEDFASTGKVTLKVIGADFTEEPDLLRGKGALLCEALSSAKVKRQRTAALVAANLLSALPRDEFVSLEEQLLPLLGSRVLALEWQITPELDVKPLPKDCPKWGEIAGFGLMSRVPGLWERLGELGPLATRITALFIKEVGERPMLVTARERFRARGMELPDV
jgi:hypothetical protein